MQNILFSGLQPRTTGRHALLQVLEEFEMERDTKPHRNSKDKLLNIRTTVKNQILKLRITWGWEAPNAIFIHAYDKLTFEQSKS